MIWCRSGWVRVLYEGQGDPFLLHAGDCVNQPPQIRHRVIESSGDLEVIEIACPASHDTIPDPDMVLPSAAASSASSSSEWFQQTFCRFVGAQGIPWRSVNPYVEEQEVGMLAATKGDVLVRRVRWMQAGMTEVCLYENEVSPASSFHFLFVHSGELRVKCDDEVLLPPLKGGDSIVMPPQRLTMAHAAEEGTEILQVVVRTSLMNKLT